MVLTPSSELPLTGQVEPGQEGLRDEVPREPESTRMETGVSTSTGSWDNMKTSGSSWMVLTAGRGGLMGRFMMKLPGDAQYRHNPPESW